MEMAVGSVGRSYGGVRMDESVREAIVMGCTAKKRKFESSE